MNVEPRFAKLPAGSDPVTFIVSANLMRRDQTKGQKAMALAMLYPEPEKGGRGKKRQATNSLVSSGFSQQRLSQARAVLHYSRELAESVRDCVTPLDQPLLRLLYATASTTTIDIEAGTHAGAFDRTAAAAPKDRISEKKSYDLVLVPLTQSHFSPATRNVTRDGIPASDLDARCSGARRAEMRH